MLCAHRLQKSRANIGPIHFVLYSADAENNGCRPTWPPPPPLLHKRYTALFLHFRVDGVQATQAQSIPLSMSFYGAPPSGVTVYLTTVTPSHLVILKSDQLTALQPWSQHWQLYDSWQFMWVNLFEAVFINCVRLNHPQIYFDLSRRNLGQQLHCLQGWLLQQHTGGPTGVSAR